MKIKNTLSALLFATTCLLSASSGFAQIEAAPWYLTGTLGNDFNGPRDRSPDISKEDSDEDFEVVEVIGTDRAETVTIRLFTENNRDRVEIQVDYLDRDGDEESTDREYDLDDVDFVAFAGFGGNDRVTVVTDQSFSVTSEFLLNDRPNPFGFYCLLGDGDDQFSNHSALASYAEGGHGRDTLRGGSNSDILRGNPVGHVHPFYGHSFADDAMDYVAGNGGDDLLIGEIVDGGPGDDILLGGDVRDGLLFSMLAFGGDGNDWIEGSPGVDIIYGGPGNDVIVGLEGENTIYGGDGHDLLFAAFVEEFNLSNAGSLIMGEEGNDVMIGSSNDDELHGGNGDDEVFGQHGNDLIRGGSGNIQAVRWVRKRYACRRSRLRLA